MRVLVCVKHVPDGVLRFRPDSLRLERSGPGDLNSVDRYAIEEALRLKEAGAGTEVVLVSMGPAAAADSLRTGLALGADRAVLVSDEAAEGSDLVASARVLARVLTMEHPDLVLFGQQTRDGGGALLWAAVADLMGRPFASQAIDLTMSNNAVRVTRQTEVGDEVIEVQLPALISVSESINEPRYTSLKGLMGAKKKPLSVLGLADLGLEPAEVGTPGSRTTVLGTGAPPARANAVKVEDGGAQAIVEFLVERQLI
jgi:electron transfer flavoprotein beta subunit